MGLLPRRIDWYCVREMVAPFCTWMMALLVVIEGNFLFLLLKAAKSHDLPFLQIVLFLAFKLPFSIVLAIPMSYLFAVCLGIARLAQDEEVTAMRAAGLSSRRILRPFLVAGFGATLTACCSNEVAVPWANHISLTSVRQIFLQQAQLMPEANVFIRGPEGFVFYSGDVDVARGVMHDTMVFRPSGTGFPDIWIADTSRFEDNRIYMTDVRHFAFGDDGTVRQCGSAESQFMDLKEIMEAFYRNQRERPDELSFRELLEQVRVLKQSGQQATIPLYELHSKLSIPCATLVFVFLGAPLSLRFGRRGGFAGTLIAIVMIFFYYCFMAWGQILVRAGSVNPFWAAWTQNLAFLAVGAVMLWRIR